jgi:hypothetical protein
MPTAMIAQLKEYAWENRTSVSQVVRDVLDEYRNNPKAYTDLTDMEGSLSGSLTVYVPDDPWLNVRDTAYLSGRIPVSVIIRKGVKARLVAENIPETA